MAKGSISRVSVDAATTQPPDDFASKLVKAVAEFGAAVREPLAAGVGRPEDQIGDPCATLIRRAGRALGLKVVTHAEASLRELSVRPDYAVDAASGRVGYIEVKAPGKGADPSRWPVRSHDGQQWQRLRLLPNVLYTDGHEWAIYHSGERSGEIARLTGDLTSAGLGLRPADTELARVIAQFLWWEPERPRTLRQLVRAVARLCRFLREEVLEVLDQEERREGDRPFTTLANEWREILFPRLIKPDAFADAYAQTTAFALLLARHAGVSFEGRSVPDIANKLGKQHALLGRALDVLTDPRAADNLVILETLRRVIGAVDWEHLDVTTADTHALLYETFLEEYDAKLRQQSGSYYTPDPVARGMVRFADEILRNRLGRPWGFAADDVIVVDPAMGTGTFLVEVIDAVADAIAGHQGSGALAQRLRELFQRRLIGFERQVTPYAVAELRLHEALKTRYGVEVPGKEMRFLTDTFEDPDTQQIQFGRMYQELQESREGANKVKRDVPVMVVIGNPPYLDRAHTRDPAPWIERRREPRKPADVGFRPSLDEFRVSGKGRIEYKLSDTYIFYWRWATWKVFDAHPDQPASIVAFITPSSYLHGEAFAGMRAYLRRVADEGWIIDVTPEGHQPPVGTRIFRGVQQPLCIGVFARYDAPDASKPAQMHHVTVGGNQQAKLGRILQLALDDADWAECTDGWQDPFLPASTRPWQRYPLLGDLMPWQRPGVKPNRTWVYAPDRDVLRRRWARLIGSAPEVKDMLLKPTSDRKSTTIVSPILETSGSSVPLSRETLQDPVIVRVAYRSLDRQYLILDARVIDRPRPELLEIRADPQIFVSEQHANQINDGPGLTFAALVPDMDHYQGHHGGGCCLSTGIPRRSFRTFGPAA